MRDTELPEELFETRQIRPRRPRTESVRHDYDRVFRGRDRIREWSDAEFIGKQVTLDVTGVRTDGSTTVVSAQVGGNGFNGPSDFAFDVSGDKVALMRITG